MSDDTEYSLPQVNEVNTTDRVRQVSNETITRNRLSEDSLESQILTRERYDDEYIQILTSGTADLIDVYNRASDKCKVFIYENPALILAFSGMLPEASLSQQDLQTFSEELEEVRKLTHDSHTQLRTAIVGKSPRTTFLNKAALVRLRRKYPNYMKIPAEVPDEDVVEYIVKNGDDYLDMSAKGFDRESFENEVRSGLMSGYELESCKIFAALSVYGLLHPKNPETPKALRWMFTRLEKIPAVGTFLRQDEEIETLLSKIDKDTESSRMG